MSTVTTLYVPGTFHVPSSIELIPNPLQAERWFFAIRYWIDSQYPLYRKSRSILQVEVYAYHPRTFSWSRYHFLERGAVENRTVTQGQSRQDSWILPLFFTVRSFLIQTVIPYSREPIFALFSDGPIRCRNIPYGF
jgi:hypothetical protein